MAQSNDKKTLEEVRGTIVRIYHAFENLDAKLLDENFSHGDELLAFGTDWDEKFDGWKQYKDVHTVQFQAVKSFKFQMKELSIHSHDGVAWISDRPHWEVETKAGEKVSSDMRITAVLKKDETTRRWLVVQWHVSVGLRERLHEY
ncbi:MAG: nuclear transport factor 2 family protein [Thaumarchaeota archaeon]|nr:nuclear transport factor 2 family protein [Nitrososphaerota archaeon]